MRRLIRAFCWLAPLLLQACGDDAGRPGLAVSPGVPQPKDDPGPIGTFGINTCPVAISQNLTTPSGVPLSIQLQGTDADGDALSIALTSSAAHGSLVLAQAGAVTYYPVPGYCGPDAFTFDVSDGQCISPDGTVFINVVCNRCPVAGDLSVDVNQGSHVDFQLPASDPDGDALLFMVTQPPAHGSVLVAATGAATYTPDPGYTGPDMFMFAVDDGICPSNEAAVSISVHAADTDGDGVPDGDDDCPDSDLEMTVRVGDCDTGVPNLIEGAVVNAGGCSLADLIHGLLETAAAEAENHGQFVSAMSRLLRNLARLEMISAGQHGAIMRCVALADESDFRP